MGEPIVFEPAMTRALITDWLAASCRRFGVACSSPLPDAQPRPSILAPDDGAALALALARGRRLYWGFVNARAVQK